MDRDNYTVEPNYIVNIPCAKIREIARGILKNNWVKVTMAFALYYIFTTLVSNILDIPFSYQLSKDQMVDSVANFLNASSEQVQNAMKNVKQSDVGKVQYGGLIYEYLICPAFNLGLCMFMFEFFRKRKANITMIFDGMSYWTKAVWLMFMMSVKIILWSLLLVVPGIIAAIRYGLSFFVLADHPDWKVSQCMRESCRLMRGNKLKFILLYLSFIGWFLLACIPSSFIGDLIDIDAFMKCFTDFIFAIPVMVVSVYIYISQVAFYELAAGNMKLRRVDEETVKKSSTITEAFNEIKTNISNPENAVQKILDVSAKQPDKDESEEKKDSMDN